MRPAPLVRRSIALTAATALISGGLATGFLAAPALAAFPAATVTSSLPALHDNRTAVSVQVTGEGFLPGDVIVLRPADVQPWVSEQYEAHDVVDLESGAIAVSPAATTMTGTVNVVRADSVSSVCRTRTS
jgi:hypothetical protein